LSFLIITNALKSATTPVNLPEADLIVIENLRLVIRREKEAKIACNGPDDRYIPGLILRFIGDFCILRLWG
jgi:hypothetical protein